MPKRNAEPLARTGHAEVQRLLRSVLNRSESLWPGLAWNVLCSGARPQVHLNAERASARTASVLSATFQVPLRAITMHLPPGEPWC